MKALDLLINISPIFLGLFLYALSYLVASNRSILLTTNMSPNLNLSIPQAYERLTFNEQVKSFTHDELIMHGIFSNGRTLAAGSRIGIFRHDNLKSITNMPSQLEKVLVLFPSSIEPASYLENFSSTGGELLLLHLEGRLQIKTIY